MNVYENSSDSCFLSHTICAIPHNLCNVQCCYMGVSKNKGTPKSWILIVFSIINHPFWVTPIFGNTHIKSTCLELAPSAPGRQDLIQYPSRMAMAEARPLNRLDSARKEQSETFGKKLKQHWKNAVNSKGRFDDSWSEGVHSDLQRWQPGCDDTYRNPEESFQVLTQMVELFSMNMCIYLLMCVHHCIISNRIESHKLNCRFRTHTHTYIHVWYFDRQYCTQE